MQVIVFCFKHFTTRCFEPTLSAVKAVGPQKGHKDIVYLQIAEKKHRKKKQNIPIQWPFIFPPYACSILLCWFGNAFFFNLLLFRRFPNSASKQINYNTSVKIAFETELMREKKRRKKKNAKNVQ